MQPRQASAGGNSLLRQAGEKLADFQLQDCPALAVETAKTALLDTLGVTLAGAATESVQAVTRAVGRGFADGPALLMGTPRRVDILSAALVNGTSAHALDFDDCSNTLGGHPSAPIMPALLALAEERASGGAEFLAAYLAGFEFETRLGRAVNFEHYEKGWHPSSTLGTFGSAAACARLMRLDAERTAIALAFAASSAAGIKANFGSMAKPFHIGQCSRAGLQAALLAEAGATANDNALEHPQGFFAVFNGAGKFAPERLLDGWAEPLDIVEPGVAYKQHPCCASTHPAIDALLSLRADHGLTPDNVERVRSFTHPRRLRHTNRPDPQNGLDGKFSVQYALARALKQGLVSIDDFSDEAVRNPDVRSIMARIEAAPHPDADMASTEHFFALVEVDTRAGHTLSAYVDRPLGRDRAHPLPDGALERKFMDCAAPLLGEATARDVAERFHALEGEADLRELVALLEPREAASTGGAAA